MWSGTGSNFWLQLVIDVVLVVVDDDIVTLDPPHPSWRGRGGGQTAGDTSGSQGVRGGLEVPSPGQHLQTLLIPYLDHTQVLRPHRLGVGPLLGRSTLDTDTTAHGRVLGVGPHHFASVGGRGLSLVVMGVMVPVGVHQGPTVVVLIPQVPISDGVVPPPGGSVHRLLLQSV